MSQIYPLPNNHARVKRLAYPAFLEGIDHFYYFNSTDQLTDANFSDWRLALVDHLGNQLSTNLATLTKDGTSPYRFYFTFKITEGLATGKICRFVIYNSASSNPSNQIVYLFAPFKVIDLNESKRWVYVQYRNSYNIFNYNYGHSEYDTKYNNIFLPLNLLNTQPEDEIKTYTKASDGLTNILKSQSREVLILESDFVDKNIIDLMKILPLHDDVLINGLPVISKSSIKVNESKFNNLKRVTWEVYDESYSSVNVN